MPCTSEHHTLWEGIDLGVDGIGDCKCLESLHCQVDDIVSSVIYLARHLKRIIFFKNKKKGWVCLFADSDSTKSIYLSSLPCHITRSRFGHKIENLGRWESILRGTNEKA